MKLLISPLLLIFFLLVCLTSALACSRRREQAGSLRAWFVLCTGFILGVLLYFPATWMGSEWLRSTLTAKVKEEITKNSEWQPEWIVVLAGGIIRGNTPNENILSGESGLRVAYAVTLAEHYPKAGLIFAGGLPGDAPADAINTRCSVVYLMREFAVGRGIDPDRCRLEFASTNTREHPQGILALDGVTQDSRLLVVSSDWHLPRVRMVFDPVFDDIRYDGSSMRLRPGPLWHRLIPSEEALAASALYFREWVGRGWYWVRS